MTTRIRQLAVKIKSLAAEGRIIREEERRALRRADRALHRSLEEHRKGIVRSTAREAILAMAMLRDRPYARIELRTQTPPDLDKVRTLATRFGAVRVEPGTPEGNAAWAARQAEQKARFDAWQKAATAHIKGAAAPVEPWPQASVTPIGSPVATEVATSVATPVTPEDFFKRVRRVVGL